MYVDSIKIGNANARAIRTVVDLEAVPTQVFENSPMLIKVGETLYVKNKVAGTIIGTWHLKDTISYATNVGVNFDFVSNDTTYTALLWQHSELHYASQATSDVVVYNESGWVNQAYRTIVIKSGENADLLAFLRASAEKLIDGYYYYTAVSGSAVIEKYTQDMENFADIVFTADEFNTILNSNSVVVKLNIANIQNIFFAKAMQVADGSNQDIVYLNSYVATAGMNFVLGLVKPHDSTQVAHIVLKQTLPEPPTAINLNDSFPSTATNGTLESTQLRTLQASDQNYIIFNNELFRLNDKQHNEGYLVYSHNGHDTTGCFFQKCITITLSTLGWVLETQENQAKLTAGEGITIQNNVISAEGGSPITYVDTLPEANEEEFEKHKIYQQGSTLKFIGGEVPENPPISLENTLPQALYSTSAAAVGSNIYIFGGNGSGRANTIYKLDTTTNVMTTLSAKLPGVLSDTSAAAVGSNIYIFGGNATNTIYSKDIYKFDTKNNILTTLSTTLPKQISSTSAAAVGSNIYIFGGIVGSYVNTIYKLDTTNNSITKLSTTLPQALGGASAIAVGSNVYIFGGYNGSDRIKSIYKLDTTTNVLTTLSTTLPKKLYGTSAATVGSNVYIFGGQTDSTTYSNTIYKLDTTSDTLTTLSTTLPQALYLTSAAAVGNNIYVIGGTATSYSNTIYELSLGLVYSFKTILQISVQVNDDDTIDLTIN